MSEQDDLEAQVAARVRQAMVSITEAMAKAFDEVWSRPDAGVLAFGFLEGRIAFQVNRYGVLILAEPEADGAAVPDTPEGLE